MKNSGLDEAKAGIKIASRNINNLRYADETTLMPETKREQKDPHEKLNRRVKKFSAFRKLKSWHLIPSLHGK